MTFARTAYWMSMMSVTNGTPYIPGDGKGSALARVAGPLNLTALLPNRLRAVTLSALTSIAIGQLLVTTDGYFGSITDFQDKTAMGSFATSLAANTLTSVGHGIANGTTVIVREATPGGGVPAPLTEGRIYFVVGTAADTLQLSLTSGGAAIDITGANRDVLLWTVDSADVVVDQWRSGSKKQEAAPATGTSNVNVFPAGSILAGMQAARIERIVIGRSITGVSANYLLDYRLATATPVVEFNSVVGVVGDVEIGADVTAPFFAQVGTTANFGATIVFSLN